MKKFTFTDLLDIYKTYETTHGAQAYKYISQVFIDAKPLHKAQFVGRDYEQS